MTEPAPTSIVIVGQGVIGSVIGERLRALGARVLHVTRRPTTGAMALDLTTVRGRTHLSEVLSQRRPDAVVLAHGPMDVDWCATHEATAVATHADTAEAVVRSGARPVLVSSDAVFSGEEALYADDALPSPAGAYGRAKLAAESRLHPAANAAIVRLSYVYGRLRRPVEAEPRFDVACLMALSAGEEFLAPTDQHFTPISVHDVGRVLAAIVLGRVSGTFHLAGPRRLSRFEFALEMARRVGAPPGRVIPAPRSATRWASRPPNSCLRSSDFAAALGWSSFRPLDPTEGIALFVAEAAVSRRSASEKTEAPSGTTGAAVP